VTLPPSKSGETDRDTVAALRFVHQLQQALQRSDRAQLVHCLKQLVVLRAPMGGQWQALAHLAAQNGELTLAREAIDLFVEASGGSPLAQYQKAALLEQSGALRDAYELMRTLPEGAPDPAANAFSRGTAALFLGETGEARRRLEMATRLRPESGAAWLSLAMSANLADEPELAQTIITAERFMANADVPQRAAYCFALGKARAERGEHALAFDAFARGGEAMKSLARYDREADRREVEETMRGYDRDVIAALSSRQREPTGRSIFVAGLPRSGTTLVDQILTSHSAIGGGGEINRLVLLANEIGGNSCAALSRYIETGRAEEAARLWRHWLDERFPAPGLVVDKTLNTTRLIGIAAALLPEAPLIWLTRNPLDRAWSCFRTFFVVSMPWSYDLEDIAFLFRLEDRLLQHWQQVLGERLLVVPYESLVEDPRPWIRRILAHCGLAEEPRVFAPHENSRPVTTASVMQVRRPINRQGIGAAEPYRRFLEPFIAAYCL
jgi:tetratricopeptide (TPR) repeat protein